MKKVSLDVWIQLIGMLGIFEKTDAMSHYPHPKGWTYSSRVLSEDLELNSEGVVNVLAIRSKYPLSGKSEGYDNSYFGSRCRLLKS